MGLLLDGPGHSGCRLLSNPHRQPIGGESRDEDEGDRDDDAAADDDDDDHGDGDGVGHTGLLMW